MQHIVLDAEAAQIFAELAKHGVANTRVHVLVNVMDGEELPMTAIAEAGKGFGEKSPNLEFGGFG